MQVLRVEFDGNLFEKECVFVHSFFYVAVIEQIFMA